MSDGHWSHMGKLWRYVGPPLRPAPEDLAIFQDAILRWSANRHSAPRTLILGVTPELYGLNWPDGTTLYALDASRQMIESVWPGPTSSALQGAWTTMPLASGSCDIIVCDGGLGMLTYPQEQEDMLRELHRILAPGGIFVVRLFAPGGRTGSIKTIFADLGSGQIASIDILKLRLWGALHTDARQGVSPREVVANIQSAVGDFDRLAEEHGWPLDLVRALALHRQSTVSYHLTAPAELLRMASGDPGGFECLGIVEPSYTLGNCCPILTLTRI